MKSGGRIKAMGKRLLEVLKEKDNERDIAKVERLKTLLLVSLSADQRY